MHTYSCASACDSRGRGGGGGLCSCFDELHHEICTRRAVEDLHVAARTHEQNHSLDHLDIPVERNHRGGREGNRKANTETQRQTARESQTETDKDRDRQQLLRTRVKEGAFCAIWLPTVVSPKLRCAAWCCRPRPHSATQ
jgi:hypothetical protein